MATSPSPSRRRSSDSLLRAAFRGEWSEQQEEELATIQQRLAEIPERTRGAIDLGTIALFGFSVGALLVVVAVAFMYLVQSQVGLAMLFSAVALVAFPLIVFLGWRALQPLLHVKRGVGALQDREALLREQRENALLGDPYRSVAEAAARVTDNNSGSAADEAAAVTDVVAARAEHTSAITSANAHGDEGDTPTTIAGLFSRLRPKRDRSSDGSHPDIDGLLPPKDSRESALRKAEDVIGVAPKMPHWWSPTGWREEASSHAPRPTHQRVSGLAIFLIVALILVLFASGVIAGVMSASS